MSVRSQVAQQLAQAVGAGAVVLSLDTGRGRLTIDLAGVESIGCEARSIALESDRLAGVGPDDLQRLGEALAARVTYLLEPLRPLELDREGFTLQMRSVPPEKDDEGTRYFEITARRGGEIQVFRFQKDKGQPRRPIAAHLTHQTLARLCDDLHAVLP